MSQAEKVSEPSMDEILASIRKIIAEEPAGTKSPAAGVSIPEPKRGPPAPAFHANPVQPQPATTAAPKSPVSAGAPPVSSSASVVPTPASPRPTELPRASKEDQNALNHLLLEEDLADLVDPSPLPAAPASGAAPALQSRPGPAPMSGAVGVPLNGLSTTGLPAAAAAEKPGWRFPRPAPRPDAGLQRPPLVPAAVAEAIMPTPRPPAATTPPVDRSDDAASLARSLAARVAVQAPPPAPQSAPAPSEVSLTAAKEAAIKAAARDAASKAAASALDAMAAGRAVAGPAAPVKADVTSAPVVSAPVVSAQQVVEAAVPVAETHADVGTFDAPVLDAAAKSVVEPVIEAPLIATKPEAPREVAVVVADAPVVATKDAGKGPIENSPAATAEPVVAAASEPAIASGPAIGVAGLASGPSAPAAAPAARTMEDTVAELLRPMLREWLDNNMPRIVEKAMRVEMASIVKPAGK